MERRSKIPLYFFMILHYLLLKVSAKCSYPAYHSQISFHNGLPRTSGLLQHADARDGVG